MPECVRTFPTEHIRFTSDVVDVLLHKESGVSDERLLQISLLIAGEGVSKNLRTTNKWYRWDASILPKGGNSSVEVSDGVGESRATNSSGVVRLLQPSGFFESFSTGKQSLNIPLLLSARGLQETQRSPYETVCA